MRAAQSFKSHETHDRILRMLYAAVYSEIYVDAEWRDYALREFNKLASAGDFLPRTFNCGGRLFLCFAFRWLVNKGIVRDSERLGEIINRLFYREEILWDCAPDIIPAIDSDIDGEGVVMLTLFNDKDTLERYALQEKMIAHLNGLDIILSGKSKFENPYTLHPLIICSILHFVMECDKKVIFPVRTTILLNRIHEIWFQIGVNEKYDVLFKYILNRHGERGGYEEELYNISAAEDEIAMFLFLHGLSEVYATGHSESLPVPDKVNDRWGHLYCLSDVMMKYGRNEK